jgi:nucleotide-binding universal stress UspA family protein
MQAGLPAERAGQRCQRGLQPELVERLRPQPSRDAADVLGAAPCLLAQLLEIDAERRRATAGNGLAAQHEPGERLPDLIVQLAGDPPALALLGAQRPQRALAALVLQAIEHVVERVRQRDDLIVAVSCVDPLAGSQRVDPSHQSGEPLERSQDAGLSAYGATEATTALQAGKGVTDIEGELRTQAETALRRQTEALGDGVPVETDAFVEDPADVLIRVSEHLDLIVCGSRGYGPLRAVLLGGVSRRLAADARCPVIVLPRGVEDSLEALMAETPRAAAG